MKTSSFISGLALGAVAAIAINKKFFGCKCAEGADCDSSAVKDAEETAEKLRSSTDSLLAQLSKSNEEKHESEAKVKELEDKLSNKETEIENLKNIIDANNAQTKKLEQELEQVKASK